MPCSAPAAPAGRLTEGHGMQDGHHGQDGFERRRGYGTHLGFHVEVDDVAGCVIARGELDLGAVEALREAIGRSVKDGRVVVDLRLATFMDSSAAEVFLDLLDAGTTPVLEWARPPVARVLRLLGLGSYLRPTS
ncbi:MAG: STAS domain-containing protein [Actinomycetota bacterium]